MIKVLVTAELSDYNPYMGYLRTGMGDEVDITFDIDSFWNSDQYFDIVHIHWPEHVAGYRMADPDIANKYEERLHYWKGRNASLIITRHNYVPHVDEHNLQKSYNQMYDASYKLCDAIIHIGQPSLQEFEDHLEYSKTRNILINHPNYFVGTPNEITREEARKRLGISNSDTLFLTFGILRKLEEEIQLIDAFLRTNIKNKKLLITRSYMRRTRPTKKYPFKRLIHEIKMFRYKRKGIVFDGNDVIDTNDTQVYVNASDVVISPRINSLTSGIVYMAFTFGRVVIGPDSGNIGWLLKETGNPFFQPNDLVSMAQAMEEGVKLSKTDLPQHNLDYVKEYGDIYLLGKQYIALFKELINQKDSQ